jgi:hypothetical protein
LYVGGYREASVWRAGRWQIVSQLDYYLAINSDTEEGRKVEFASALTNRRCVHESRARIRNLEIFLHHRCGAADFPTDRLAVSGDGQMPPYRCLKLVRLGLIPWAMSFREMAQSGVLQPTTGENACGPVERLRIHDLDYLP